jgi:putative flippase GtrA
MGKPRDDPDAARRGGLARPDGALRDQRRRPQLAEPLAVPALVANTIAFLVNLGVGWGIHSRWSFAGHGPEKRPRAAYARFFLVNIAGYALNSLWVWLIVERLQGSVTVSLIPIVLATPLFMFWANRRWTFS